MRYSLTDDLRTGNDIIDSQHETLFGIINDLFEACEKGKGRDSVVRTAKFLQEYVTKHFYEEETLQKNTGYPEYQSHRLVHEKYKENLGKYLKELDTNIISISALSDLNKIVAQLISHIKIEDKKMARHVQSAN